MPSPLSKYNQLANKLLPWTIVAFFVGSGLAYGQLRAFHILGLLVLPHLLFQVKDHLKFGKYLYFWLGPLVLAAYLLSALWAPYKSEAIKYCFYIANGIFATACCFFYIKSKNHLNKVLKFLSVAVLADLFIGFIESTTSFKWFISRLSPYNTLLGVNPMYEKYYTNFIWRKDNLPGSYEFLAHQPMSFHWGPNQYGLMLAIALPFVLLTIKNKSLKTLLTALIFFLMYMVASRAIFYALITTTAITACLQVDKLTKRLALLLLVTMIITPFFPLKKLGVNYERRNKLTTVYGSTISYFVKDEGLQIDSEEPQDEGLQIDSEEPQEEKTEDGSVNNRKKMLFGAWKDFRETKYRGIGAGGSLQDAGGMFGKTQIHNYWLEQLVELGYPLYPIVLLWYGAIAYNLFILRKRLQNLEDKNLVQALLVAGASSIPAIMAVGTAAYHSAFWTLIALSIGAIRGLSAENDNLLQHSNPARTQA